MKDSQKKKILDFMLDNGGITKKDAFRKPIYCSNLPGRIFELRYDGYTIETDWVIKRDKKGKVISRYAIYRLVN